jgi:transcription elongation factor GreA
MNNSGKVIFGANITLLNLDHDEEITYQIVGEDEADLKQQKVSVKSPLARSLIGHHEGEEVTVQTPSGHTHYEIVEVRYAEK